MGTKKVVVVGSGIIGSAMALHLQERGAQVTVIDANLPGATAASFGWINDSFYLTPEHYRLRAESLAAYRALAQRVALPLDWCGSLAWDLAGTDLAAQHDALRGLGADVEWVDAAQFARLEPHVARAPEAALLFAREAVADPVALARALLAAAEAAGAQQMRGIAVTGFATRGERVTGVRTAVGDIAADEVVTATGTSTQKLLQTLDIPLPMRDRPALTILTRPVAPLTRRVLVSPVGDIRQLPGGEIAMPADINHQASASDQVADPEQTASDAVARLGELFGQRLEWQRATMAWRPMPADSLPVMGTVRPGLYVAAMHSGITLAAIAGDLGATEVLEGPSNRSTDLLATFRPERFA